MSDEGKYSVVEDHEVSLNNMDVKIDVASGSKSLRFQDGNVVEADLAWKTLDKFITSSDAMADGKDSRKQILFGVSGVARAGEMCALMGPSGCGKTTLLNVLGGRALADLTGQTYINGIKFKKSMKRLIAYVLQEDIFYTNLTVRQQLHFTSHLRLPDSLTNQEKLEAVERVIKILRIQKCANTPIFLISGGEKKRCNIGTELLTNPSVLLLDEPTSGLDSTAANSLIVTLRALASERMTIVTSIHQPSSKVFYAFDKLLLLADGHIVYSGPPAACMTYLARLGFYPPADYNPADYIMDLVTTVDVDAEAGAGVGDTDKPVVHAANGGALDGPVDKGDGGALDGPVDKGDGGALDGPADKGMSPGPEKSIRGILIAAWDNGVTDGEADAALASALSAKRSQQHTSEDGAAVVTADAEAVHFVASYRTQFLVLLERALLNSKSQSMTGLAFIETIGMSVICGLVWFRMPYEEKRINDRAGYIFFFQSYWFIMTLYQGMMQFLPERTILLKERSAGSFRLSAYYISKTISELPIKMFMPFLFLAISYPMSNLNPSARIFFAVVSIQLLATLCGESVGIFIGTITVDFQKALVYATLTSMALMLTGGFFAQRLPVFVHWFRYLSPFKYSYDGCITLVFSTPVPCQGGVIMAQCAAVNGGPAPATVASSVVVAHLGSTESVALNAGMLILFMICFRLFAYLALRFIPHNSGRK